MVNESDNTAQPINEMRKITDLTSAIQLSGDPILKFFKYDHLPEKLQVISAPFGKLAAQIAANVPRSAERTVAFRKLLEAKDAAVRAMLD